MLNLKTMLNYKRPQYRDRRTVALCSVHHTTYLLQIQFIYTSDNRRCSSTEDGGGPPQARVARVARVARRSEGRAPLLALHEYFVSNLYEYYFML